MTEDQIERRVERMMDHYDRLLLNGDISQDTYNKGVLELSVWADFKRMEGKMTPFNLALHEHLTSLGYQRTRQDATWEDDGDAESGPHLIGGPAYDEYSSADEYVFASENGTLDRMPRDQHLENWLDEQQCEIYAQASNALTDEKYECPAGVARDPSNPF